MNTSCKRVESFAKQKACEADVDDSTIEVFRLSVDPGKHTGWALFGDALVVACGTGRPGFSGVRQVVIELPQNYPSNPVPPQDLITLSFLAGRYAGAAIGAEIFTVFPHQWKGNLSKEVCAARVRTKLSQEELVLVDGLKVPKGEKHNVMDAIGIGLFAFRGIRL